MYFEIIHTLTYTYAQPVVLGPHLLRLRPRANADQQLLSYHLEFNPEPLGRTEILEAEGHSICRCWWPETQITQLQALSRAKLVTHCTNPFSYLLESWATQFPLDYPCSLRGALSPYLDQALDPVASQLAAEIALEVDNNVSRFLMVLTQRIHQECQYQVRGMGAPWPPWMTWNQRQGTCRDFVVLWMAACRSMGLAARFVSGYEAGDPEHEQTLHAWAEVYLPGAGWRGYDPTMGLVVCDRHVALVAHALPHLTAPFPGELKGLQSRSSSHFQVEIHTQPEPPEQSGSAQGH